MTIALYRFASLCMGLFFCGQLQAQIMGADISYLYLGEGQDNNQLYQIIVDLYYHCPDPTPRSQVDLRVSSETCGGDTLYSLARMNDEGIEVTPITQTDQNPDCLVASKCNGGELPGVLKYRYTNIGFINPLSLNCEANDWIISTTDLNRNVNISNLQLIPSNDDPNEAEEGLYIEAVINNTGGQANSSPVFGSLPIPYFCKDYSAQFPQGVIEGDGDVLVFTSINPLMPTGATFDYDAVPTPYASGYSSSFPIKADDYAFDTNSGLFSFTPTIVQNAVVTVLVQEFDAITGAFKGSVMRDVQVIVTECENNQVAVCTAPFETDNLILCPGEVFDYGLSLCDNDGINNLEVKVSTLNEYGDTLTTVNSNAASPLLFTDSFVSNDEGIYTLIIEGQDNACPFYSSIVETYNITVTQDVVLPNNVYTYCISNSLEVMPVEVFGCGPFTISPEPIEVLYDDYGNPIAILPDSTQNEYVIENSYGASKTLSVTYVNGFDLHVDSPQNIVCVGESMPLTTNLEGLSDVVACTYTWTSDNGDLSGLSCTDCPNPVVSPTANITYRVTVNNCSNNCERSAYITVEVEAMPTLNISNNINVINGPTLLSLQAEGNYTNLTWQPSDFYVTNTTTFTATATSENGCETVQTHTITYDCTDLLLPSAFSPNNDGKNDVFGVVLASVEMADTYSNTMFTIYDRWHTEVFTTTKLNDGWNGTFKAETLPIGSYFYILSTICPDGEAINKQGTVLLIR